ncbi:hypothetical protein KAU11_11995 [Candidatus Babeliales bacterium]|nr:hypothetical protein [Candidatus Babeliales bacterium]
MKFSVARKINLELINSKCKFENEDISVQDADSIEEAHQALDKAVAERIGYLRAKAEVSAPPAQETVLAPPPAPTTTPSADGVSDQIPSEFNV